MYSEFIINELQSSPRINMVDTVNTIDSFNSVNSANIVNYTVNIQGLSERMSKVKIL